MITLRAAILLGLCFVIVVGTRCSCCKCDEVDVKYTSAFKEMELVSLDNSGKDTASVVNNTVNRNAYAVKMVLLSSIGTLAHLPCRHFDVFIGSANAMGCRCSSSGKYIPTDSIISISITDLEAFDVNTPANSDISSRFRYYDSYAGGSYIEVDQLLSSGRQSLLYPGSYYSSPADPMASLQSGLMFMLMEPPASSGIHRFKFSLLLKSGIRIEQTTSTIMLQ